MSRYLIRDLRVLKFIIAFAIVLTPWAACAQSFSTDFKRKINYKVPHKYNTTKKAVTFVDGQVAFTIRPGMHGAGTDKAKGSERAEFGVDVNRAKFIRQSFTVRVGKGFKATDRTMIAQIKQGRTAPGLGSPPVAVYLNNGGVTKCNDYSSGKPSQDEVRTRRYGIRLDDGAWHKVVMELVLSQTNGVCRIFVDGQLIQSARGIDTLQKGDRLMSRIGPYRNAVPYAQVIYFDDWSVKGSRKVPKALQ